MSTYQTYTLEGTRIPSMTASAAPLLHADDLIAMFVVWNLFRHDRDADKMDGLEIENIK